MPDEMSDDAHQWGKFSLADLRKVRDRLVDCIDTDFGPAGYLFPELLPVIAEETRVMLAEMNAEIARMVPHV